MGKMRGRKESNAVNFPLICVISHGNKNGRTLFWELIIHDLNHGFTQTQPRVFVLTKSEKSNSLSRNYCFNNKLCNGKTSGEPVFIMQ